MKFLIPILVFLIAYDSIGQCGNTISLTSGPTYIDVTYTSGFREREEVEYSSDGITWQTVPALNNPQRISSLEPNRLYTIRVRYLSSGCYSLSSAIFTRLSAPVLNAVPFNQKTSDSFTATWSAVSGATYLIRVTRVSDGVIVINNLDVGNATSYEVTGLDPDEEYSFSVRAMSSLNSSFFSTFRTVWTYAETPVASAASNISTTSFQANWSSSLGASSYDLRYADNSSLNPGTSFLRLQGLSQTVSSLDPGRSYYYTVRARNSADETFLRSNTQEVVTLPTAPTNINSNNRSTTGIDLSWSTPVWPSDGTTNQTVTGYNLYVSTTSDMSNLVSGYNPMDVGSNNSVEISGLNSGAGYYYSVTSYNNTGESTPSLTENFNTLLTTPVATSANNLTSSGFTATWNPVARATAYEIDVALNSNFASPLSSYNALEIPASNTSVDITGLTPGETYGYRLRAKNSLEVSENSNVIVQEVLSTIPNATTSSNLSANSFTANWESALGIRSSDPYLIDVSTDPLFGSFLLQDQPVTGDVNINSFRVTGLAPGTTYYYRVQSLNDAALPSGYSNGVHLETLAEVPTLLPASNITSSSFTANWNADSGASSYEIDVSADPSFSSLVVNSQTTTATSLDVSSGLTAGSVYYYRVRSVNDAGIQSANSTSIQVQLAPPTPTGVSISSITSSGFTVAWSAATSATGYLLDVSLNQDFSTFVTGYDDRPVIGTTESVTGLDPGTIYHIRVKAINGSGESMDSEVVQVETLAEIPTLLPANSITSTSFTANWNASAGASSYEIDVSADPSFSSVVVNSQTTAATSLDVSSGLTAGSVYYYRVRSVNDAGVQSANSTSIQVQLAPPTPTGLSVSSISSCGFTVEWSAATSATGYLLDVSLNQDFSTLVTGYEDRSVVGNSESVAGLDPGTIYHIRVKAINDSGVSMDSEVSSIITVPASPKNVSALSHTTTSFEISWDLIIGASRYEVVVSQNSDLSNSLFTSEPITDNSLSINNLVPGNTYYIGVLADNESGSSSHRIIATETLPLAPEVHVSNITSTGFDMSWQRITGAANYEINVRNTGTNTTVPNYPQIVAPNFVSLTVTGLAPENAYAVEIRAINSVGGYSEYSDAATFKTLKPDGTVADPPSITTQTTSNDDLTFNLINGSVEILSVRLYHKTIVDEEFVADDISYTIGGNRLAIEEEWAGTLGFQYYLEVQDIANEVVQTEITTFFKDVDRNSREIQNINDKVDIQFGRNQSNYRMISIPYELENKLLEDLFESANHVGLGVYDKTKWRLFRYDNNSYRDYSEGLNRTDIERGKSYWFVTSEPVELFFGPGKSSTNTRENPFRLRLSEGWNMIANPYLKTISWSDVLSANGNPDGVTTSLYVYNGLSYSLSDEMLPFNGAFVRSSRDITLDIPVTLLEQLSPNGRTRIANNTGREISDENWFIHLKLRDDETLNELSGVGMNRASITGHDGLDILNPPALEGYSYLSSKAEGLSLATDMVFPQENYEWQFEIRSPSSSGTRLEWNEHDINQLSEFGHLYLLDQYSGKLIDMKSTGSHLFSPQASFLSIFFTKDELHNWPGSENISFGQPYPNPGSVFHIPYYIDFNGSKTVDSSIQVYDATGRQVLNREIRKLYQGLHEFSLDAQQLQLGKGTFYFILSTTTEANSRLYRGKFIVK